MSSDSTPRTCVCGISYTRHRGMGHKPTTSTPRTTAGQRLDHLWPGDTLDRLQWREAILDIEAEAASPAASGEALREALERLLAVAMVEEEDQSPATQDEWIVAIRQANAALAASPPLSKGLDPDRLRQAAENHTMLHAGSGGLHPEPCWNWIAAEYARLASREEQL